jgi:hypothetical protein
VVMGGDTMFLSVSSVRHKLPKRPGLVTEAPTLLG